jgi:hypothetical protein
MPFAFSEFTRATLRQYGLTEEQVQHVERVEATERSLRTRLRPQSGAARLRSLAREMERAARRRR